MSKYQIIDLFSGAGGLSYGFEQAGCEIKLAIEKDAWAVDTYKANHSNQNIIEANIIALEDEYFAPYKGKIDIVMGGPPCQGFSVAGPTQYGIIDKRNTLIMEFFRFIEVIRPKYCVLENVKGILSGKMNSTQKAISVYMDALKNISYKSRVYILQAADFGVPQFRERVVIISAQDEKDLPTAIVGDFSGEKKWIKVRDVFGDLPLVNAGEGVNDLIPYDMEPQSVYQEFMRKNSNGVTNHVAMKHTRRLIERFANIPQGGSLLDAPAEYGQRQRNGNELDANKRYKTNNQRLHPDKVSFIVTASFQSTFVHPYLNRNLTAREGARLQSFPDGFFFCGPRTLMSKSLLIREDRLDEIGLSQYNQIGNAVPPRMAYGIAKAILR